MLSRRLLRIKVVQGLYSHLQSKEQSLSQGSKQLMLSTQRCYELYLLMFKLIVEVKKYAQNRIDIGLAKQCPSEQEKKPNLRFVQNPIIEVLDNSDKLNAALGANKWNDISQLVREMYEAMNNAEYFKVYMNRQEVGFDEHRKVIEKFFLHHIEDNQLLEQELEERSIFWVDNVEYALSFMVSTLCNLQEEDSDLPLLPMFKNEDDKQFLLGLFDKSVMEQEQNMELINELTKNWDLERIALMDKIIMSAALSELRNFESIPIKATLDEFIEIAKYYSTPQSGQFVNGILHKAVEALTAKGQIVKSGRGLVVKSTI